MKIYGLERLTLLDYPGKMASTVFLGGCNFRCPFCHNASLITGKVPEEIPEEAFFAHLVRRRGILGGVCITGGEPTLHPELPEFISKIKALGYSVKLDTNGYRPDVLRALIESGLIDYVAMDIKNCSQRYAETVGLPDLDYGKIAESRDLLLSGVVPYEFRTTVVRELHTPSDLELLAREIEGAERYFIQCFTDSGDVLAAGLSAYSEAELKEMLRVVRKYVKNAELRGV